MIIERNNKIRVKSSKKSQPPYSALREPPSDQMAEIVKMLNPRVVKVPCDKESTGTRLRSLSFSDLQMELRFLVARWMASGPNLRRLFTEERELAARARSGHTRLYPLEDGYCHLEWFTAARDTSQHHEQSKLLSPQDEALEYFMMLVTNENWVILGGPCQQCGQYFLKVEDRSRVYCSRKCSSAVTAEQATRKRRQKDHSEKLARAEAAIDDYAQAKRRVPWKLWVEGKTRLTSQWLSRAINKGELKEPQTVI